VAAASSNRGLDLALMHQIWGNRGRQRNQSGLVIHALLLPLMPSREVTLLQGQYFVDRSLDVSISLNKK
jgi:hypothetical protein